MSNFSSKLPHRIFVLFLLIPSLLVACTPAEEVAPGEEMDQVSEGPQTDQITQTANIGTMGFILNPGGESVPYALVGKTETSTDDGVVSGEFSSYPSGWIEAEAFGYATGYAKPGPEVWGTHFFILRLTPFQSMVYLQPESTAQLYGFLEDNISLSAEVQGAWFNDHPLFIGMTAIDPLDVGPRLVDYQGDEDQHLIYAFALQAVSEGMESIQITAGHELQVMVDLFSPLSESARVARFNPELGVWESDGITCEHSSSTVLVCSLNKLGSLFAIFDRLPSTHASLNDSTSLFTLTTGFDRSKQASLARNPLLQGEGLDQGFQIALGKLEDWLKSKEDEGGVDPEDPTLKKLIEDLANAARNYAKNNRNESGKAHLLAALQVATTLGPPTLEVQLTNEIADLVDELANEALNESDCGEFEKLLKRAEQIELTPGSSMDLHDQLIEKVEEMVKDCDVWEGGIFVSMPASSSHPAGLPMEGKGLPSWREDHTVSIWTNVDDHVMHGKDRISINFPLVTYTKDDKCKKTIRMSGGGQATLNFEGFYDGYAFQVNSVTPVGTGGVVTQTWKFLAEENEKCVTVYENQFRLPSYHSLIVHGLSSEAPMITLQEMLDSEMGIANNDFIQGSQEIVNPDPDLGMYPFFQGFIRWHFEHTQKKLPLEESGS